MNDFRSIPNSDQITGYGNYIDEEEYSVRTLLAHRFTDDVRMRIIPFESRPSRKLNIEISSKSPSDIEMYRLFGMSYEDEPVDDYEAFSIIGDFFRDVAVQLAISGAIQFEIVTSLANPKYRSLVFISGSIKEFRTAYRQHIRTSNMGTSTVDIPKSKVWQIRLPNWLGTPDSQKRLIKALAGWSDLLPSFPNAEKHLIPYEYYRNRSLAQITQAWGWVPSYISEITEYYSVHKQMQFQLTLARLREYIITSTNYFLKQLGLPNKVEMHGPPSSSIVQEKLLALQAGELNPNKALEFIYQFR